MKNQREDLLRIGVLAAVRFLSLMALPVESLLGYGDFQHFYNLALFAATGGGLPWIGHWVEFPPLFPLLSLGVYSVAAGSEHSYAYLLAILMIAFDLASLWVVTRLANRLWDRSRAGRIAWIYLAFLSIPAFGWWTFDPIAVFLMLSAVWGFYESRPYLAGISAGVGALIKYLPLLPLVLFWRFRSPRQAVTSTVLAVGLLALTVAPFFALGQDMATASLRSQASKGSWETVWALLDGNRGTGAFGPLDERLDPEQAFRVRGNPAVIPAWIPMLVALIVGAWAVLRTRSDRDLAPMGLLAMLLSLIFLASPGWSPQWLAYLIPLVLLSLVPRRAVLYTFSLALVSLLEWPVLLSRGRFDLLALPVLIRTGLLVLIVAEGWRLATRKTEVA